MKTIIILFFSGLLCSANAQKNCIKNQPFTKMPVSGLCVYSVTEGNAPDKETVYTEAIVDCSTGQFDFAHMRVYDSLATIKQLLIINHAQEKKIAALQLKVNQLEGLQIKLQEIMRLISKY